MKLDLGGFGHEVQRLLDSPRVDRPSLVHQPFESQLHLRGAGETCSEEHRQLSGTTLARGENFLGTTLTDSAPDAQRADLIVQQAPNRVPAADVEIIEAIRVVGFGDLLLGLSQQLAEGQPERAVDVLGRVRAQQHDPLL